MFFRVDERDIRFTMFEHLGVQKLLDLPAFADHSQETFDLVLSEAAKFAKEVLHPLNAAGDHQGCKFENGEVTVPRVYKQAYQAFKDAGWVASDISPDFGGQGLPTTLMIDKRGCEVGVVAGPANWDAPDAAAAIAELKGG